MEHSDFLDLCGLHKGCDLEELHTRFSKITSKLWHLVFHGNLPDNPRHSASVLQTRIFPIVFISWLPAVVMGEEFLMSVLRLELYLKCKGYLRLWITCSPLSVCWICFLLPSGFATLLNKKDLQPLASECEGGREGDKFILHFSCCVFHWLLFTPFPRSVLA